MASVNRKTDLKNLTRIGRKMKRISAFILALTFACITFAQQIKGGGFTPSTIRPDETTEYKIILEGLSGSLNPDAIPMPDGLQIVGTSSSRKISMTNNKTSSQTELIFIVRATKEGKFTVPEWKLENFKIASATLVVDKNAPEQQSRQPMMSMFGDDDEDAFGFPSIIQQMRNAQRAQMQRVQQMQQQQKQSLGELKNHISLKLQLPKEKIYVGEAIPCKLVFSFNKALDNEGVKLARLMPMANKSDAFDCTLHEDKYTTNSNDPKQISISYEVLITPLKAGNYNLDFNANGVFEMNAFFNPFGARQLPFEISTKDMKINVLPLPEENKPTSFSGAIGKFSVSDVKAEPDSLEKGEPTSVSLNVVGMGNFSRVNAPELKQSPDWKIYRPKASFSDESNGMGYIGVKHFKYTIVPTKADITSTPDFEFSFFDSEKGQYQTIAVKGTSVSVAPSGKVEPKQSKVQPQDPSKPNFDKIIKTKEAIGKADLLASPLFWIVQALILVALITFITMRVKSNTLRDNPELARKLECKKRIAIFLKSAQNSTDAKDAETFFNNARKALQNAIASVSTECESNSITLRQAEEILLEQGVDTSDLLAVVEIFNGADALAFGGLHNNDVNLQRLNSALKNICAQLK